MAAVITPQIIRQLLYPYMMPLLGSDLVNLRTELRNATKVEEIPPNLRAALQLKRFLLLRNLPEVILEEFDNLLSERCKAGKLTSKENTEFVQNHVKSHLVQYLLKLEDDQTEDKQGTIEECGQPNIILQYANHQMESISQIAKQKPEVLAKLSKNSDNLVLLVQHQIIILSNFTEEIEKWFGLLPDKISEVHFIAKEIFIADCSLNQEKWHGKNIVVMSSEFECVSPPTDGYHLWDVSGLSGRAQCSIPEKAENGLNGLPGLNGENGGNVLLISKIFNGLENLKIFSNAGSGGNGQHGGDGKDGEPGRGMSFKEMTGLFPPALISSDGIRQVAFENALNLIGAKFCDKLLYSPENAYDEETEKVTGNIDECYIEGTTKDGYKLYLSFRKGLLSKQAVCLVKGTNGTDGQKGGMGGEPGKPGIPGTVQFVSFDKPENILEVEDLEIAEISCKKGEMGRQGADGVNGSPGKSGKDVAFIALGAKETVELSAGKYELILEDSPMDKNSIKCKLLGGKFLRIGSQIGNPINLVKNGIIEIDQHDDNVKKVGPDIGAMMEVMENCDLPKAKYFVELYGSSIKSDDDIEVQLDEAEWWSKAIIEFSEKVL